MPEPGTSGPRRLTAGLTMLMLAQAATGLILSNHYRDEAWIRATWAGNDWVTLILAIPLLAAAEVAGRRGSVRGRLLVLGVAAYAIYNYCFYLFGAALNVFFGLYVAALVTAAAAFFYAITRLDVADVDRHIRADAPVRIVGGSLVVIAVGLAATWMAIWAAYAFAGRPTPVDPEAFKIVAALDLVLMVPALTIGGVLLWRRHRWGYIIATLASVQAALYLIVLTVNSVVAIQRGLAAAPGELPLWATLALVASGLAATLVVHLRPHR